MAQRFTYQLSHAGIQALRSLEDYLHDCRLEAPLLELVKMRASQINGCAFCLDMHSKGARAAGESEQRLYTLNAWRETPFFSDRERAALAWTEAVTRVADTHVPDNVYEQAAQYFNDNELLDLSLAIAAINSWNRLAIASRMEAGGYRPDLAR
ncbi:carboxymuconolactone decarboxylase family protein [Salinisphaera sp.]|uniref:carboxymuconolactone decarboxylase family protein n=1 Tax=Salinisphaera sp. TaxID=1914330 RepID=UPI002D78DDC0|nr:carboxymuconolactone decarboxylase family protein [Salinisphaera sp.]HET7314278.1 carboxymuconolactone decarboxylase family protein [Salinisphaera sp.]